MWPSLLKKTKEAGINTVETYVFWNMHEKIEGQYDFATDRSNLPLFLKLAHEHGLYVVLRIGPFVCAEWNLGGLPEWVLEKPGIKLRTFNDVWLKVTSNFVTKTIDVVKPFFYTNGGPIILLQIENEYGNIEWAYGNEGKKYVQWAADFVTSLDVGIPWIMCNQDSLDTSNNQVIRTINGFYGDKWVSDNWANSTGPRFNHPAMYTELW